MALVLPWRLNVKVDIDLDERKLGLAVGLWRGSPLTVWIDLDKRVVRTSYGVKPIDIPSLRGKAESCRSMWLAKRLLARVDYRAELTVVVGGDPYLAAMAVGALNAFALPHVVVRAYPVGGVVKGNGRLGVTFCLWDLLKGAYIGEVMEEDLLQKTMTALRGLVDADTIIGHTLATPDGSYVVPVSRLSVGVVTGSGEYGSSKTPAPYQAGGGGAGGSVTPVGFLVLGHTGVRFMSIDDKVKENKWLDLVDTAARFLRKE